MLWLTSGTAVVVSNPVLETSHCAQMQAALLWSTRVGLSLDVEDASPSFWAEVKIELIDIEHLAVYLSPHRHEFQRER